MAKRPTIRDQAGAPDYLLDEQIGFLLRLAMQRHTAIFMSKIACGLTQTQFAALAKLQETGPCSQNQLGRLVGLDAATAKGVVDRLHARRLLTVCADPLDRRRRTIALTEAGREIADDAIKAAKKITVQTLAPLSAAERRTVTRLLKKLT